MFYSSLKRNKKMIKQYTVDLKEKRRRLYLLQIKKIALKLDLEEIILEL
tara:strand:+ start:327 stop:473 length:147 start_codon:yes stop_codon:yes gene_type:complete